MRPIGVFVVVVSVFCPTLAFPQVPFFNFGEGTASCGEFLQAAEAERKERPPTARPTEVYNRHYGSFMPRRDGPAIRRGNDGARLECPARLLPLRQPSNRYVVSGVWAENRPTVQAHRSPKERGETLADIARSYNVSPATISRHSRCRKS